MPVNVGICCAVVNVAQINMCTNNCVPLYLPGARIFCVPNVVPTKICALNIWGLFISAGHLYLLAIPLGT